MVSLISDWNTPQTQQEKKETNVREQIELFETWNCPLFSYISEEKLRNVLL